MGCQVAHKAEKNNGRIRIIGGKWRGRYLNVLTYPSLRPTPDRVRETLFNWLAPTIVHARCLDLFAGSGALGFEALSRGAKEVIFIDNHANGIKAIKEAAQTLQTLSHCEIISGDSLRWLQQARKMGPSFDIIFLDPPFSSELLTQSIALLADSEVVGAKTLIYIESQKLISNVELPSGWQLLKQKTAGNVAYHLVQGARTCKPT